MKNRISINQLHINHLGIAWRPFRGAGLVVALAALNVALAQDPRFTRQPTNQAASLGASITFSVAATGDSLNFNEVTAAHAGYYRALVSNARGLRRTATKPG